MFLIPVRRFPLKSGGSWSTAARNSFDLQKSRHGWFSVFIGAALQISQVAINYSLGDACRAASALRHLAFRVAAGQTVGVCFR